MMKIQVAFHLGLGFALAVAAVVSKTPPVQAQSGSQSDVTGAIVTTSDIIGGFSSGGTRRGGIAFTTPAIRNAVNNAATTINQQLAARNLPVPAVATGTPIPIPATVQENFQTVLTATGNVNAGIAQIQSDLVNAGANPTAARNLASSLQGLTAGGRVDPARLVTTVRAYNALIESNSSVASFSAESLRASQSVLAILLNAALGR